jgi:Peptidase A4 family
MPLRRLLPTVLAAFAALPAATASAGTTTSANWAGYAAHRTGVRFRSVSAAWTVPAVTCDSGRAYSAAWVGLGGYHTNAAALEQAGTESDCSASGAATYTAWYELVPQSSRTIHMTVAAGDQMAVRVAVSGHRVTIRLRDLTRGTAFLRTLTASAVDTTSSEWIVEAPSECLGARCRVLPLAGFAATTFSAARATTTTGHTGAIADALWADTAIDLSADSGGPQFGGPRGREMAGAASANTGALSAAGDAFTVTVAAT